MASRGPAAIVTGAAQGIGYAVSNILLQEGYRVCLADINKEKGGESLAELQKKYPSEDLIFVHCDVSSESSFRDTFSKAQQAFGRIDLLVNNAGIVDEHDPGRMLAINLMGPIIGIQLALKFMGTSGGGKGGIVVNVASLLGLTPNSNLPVYSATKHGIVGLTRAYGSQTHLDQNGVLFMAICPFIVKTPMIQSSKGLEQIEPPGLPRAIEPEFVAEGVLKLLKEKRNGSTLAALPEGHKYFEVEDELKKLSSV